MGATKNDTGGHLKIRGDWEKFKCEGAYKMSWGFEKIEGARLSGGLLQRGVLQNRAAMNSCNKCRLTLSL